jgi:oxygen-dependent protoporphyrinogen oxidase
MAAHRPARRLLTTFIGGKRNPELPAQAPSAIAALAHEEHMVLLDARTAPTFQEVTRWPQAIPQYNLGHLARVQQADTAEQALPGLFLGGSWKGGVAVGDCLRNGLGLGERIAAQL